MVLVGVYTIFHISVFYTICKVSNVYKVLFCHAFQYILLVLGLSNCTLSVAYWPLTEPLCSSCVNKMIAGCTCVNRKAAMCRCKQLMCVEPEMRRHYEIIYTQGVSYREWLPGIAQGRAAAHSSNSQSSVFSWVYSLQSRVLESQNCWWRLVGDVTSKKQKCYVKLWIWHNMVKKKDKGQYSSFQVV